MTEDVEMDAPQISTLREDDSPEPQPTPVRTPKVRVKLLVGEKGSSSLARPQTSQPPESEDEDEDEDEEEEDQLIDDDDEQEVKTTPTPSAAAAPSTRGTPVKRGAGRGRGGRKRGAKTGVTVSPAEAQGAAASLAAVPVVHAAAPKKRGGATGVGRGRGGGRKRGTGRGAKVVASMLRADDAESVISETYAGTAASSPMLHDDRSPEPDIPQTAVPALVVADVAIDLENVPFPVYPLPTKPFPVQPPPKIPTGFAPSIPLDKSKKKVRRWRPMNREIRGIAGGRWFVKSWIGDKESELASATQHPPQHVEPPTGPPSLILPKLTGPSIGGAPSGKTTPKPRLPKVEPAGSAVVSRDASAAPGEPPTKKRNLGPISSVKEAQPDPTVLPVASSS